MTKSTQWIWPAMGLLLSMACLSTACKSAPQPAEDRPATAAGSTSGPSDALFAHGPELTEGERPRFSPDGRLIAFHGGEEGSRQLFVFDTTTGQTHQVGSLPGDNREPSFTADGKRLLFASNASGSYDLYLVDLDGTSRTRVTELAGDAREPAVSPLRYSFFVVYDDGCGPEPDGLRIDVYDKVVFTYTDPATKHDEVRFISLEPAGFEPTAGDTKSLNISAHGAHQGRLSPEGEQCNGPAFSGDGLSLSWTCVDAADPEHLIAYDGQARWDQSFQDAIEAIGRGQIPECQDDWESPLDWDTCLSKLSRRYTTYATRPLVDGASHPSRVAYSTNQIVVVGDVDGAAVHRDRFDDNASWQSLATGAQDVRNVAWSPDGSFVAFDAADATGKRVITVAKTDFYLQEVQNLHQFPELFGSGTSQKLHHNRFVARPGQEREFYALYEKLRYERRPQYITADATLQVFRDEFMRILEQAEERTASDLEILSQALARHYAARFSETGSDGDRYMATYFAVPSLFLNAARKVSEEQDGENDWGMPVKQPVLPAMPAALESLLSDIPEALRAQVSQIVTLAMAHEGLGELAVPSRPTPTKIDWSQFRVRGNYAENDLAGYFLAMSWYAQAPLAFDASLKTFVDVLETLRIDGRSAYDIWSRVDTTVGSFMGKPVDATVSHLVSARKDRPEIFEPFDARAVATVLEELRGPMLIRDADSLDAQLEGGDGARILKTTFLPKRVGLDTTFFRKLTYPDAGPRPFPSSLDVMAVLGSTAAYDHATSQKDTAWADSYQQALDALLEEHRTSKDTPGYWSTDIYHSWLAVLATLATAHDVDDASLMAFTRSDAWKDRQLFSALGGYTQLKHAAVLYNAQDMSAECGGEPTYYTMIEQPILPTPYGFIDPMPSFFAGIAALAAQVYEDLNDGNEATTISWRWDEDPINVRGLAMELADLSAKAVRAEPWTEEERAAIEFIGARIEALTITVGETTMLNLQGDGRAERGILLATDIHTNPQRGEVLQITLGPVMNLYVAVPDGRAQTMTQGGIFSFYEFIHPMSDRLTDEAWMDLSNSEEAPPLPDWTHSFIELP